MDLDRIYFIGVRALPAVTPDRGTLEPSWAPCWLQVGRAGTAGRGWGKGGDSPTRIGTGNTTGRKYSHLLKKKIKYFHKLYHFLKSETRDEIKGIIQHFSSCKNLSCMTLNAIRISDGV